MAETIDATVAHVLDQQFAEQVNVFRAQQNRATAGDAAVAELVRNNAAQADMLIGARAAQTLLVDPLASSVLSQRSAGGQPQASAADAGVNSGGGAKA